MQSHYALLREKVRAGNIDRELATDLEIATGRLRAARITKQTEERVKNAPGFSVMEHVTVEMINHKGWVAYKDIGLPTGFNETHYFDFVFHDPKINGMYTALDYHHFGYDSQDTPTGRRLTTERWAGVKQVWYEFNKVLLPILAIADQREKEERFFKGILDEVAAAVFELPHSYGYMIEAEKRKLVKSMLREVNVSATIVKGTKTFERGDETDLIVMLALAQRYERNTALMSEALRGVTQLPPHKPEQYNTIGATGKNIINTHVK